MILSLLLAASVATPATERIAIDHAGRPITAQYRAETVIEHRQVGAVAGTRMGTRRCNWTAAVRIHRDAMIVDGTVIPALSRTLPGSPAIAGSRHGECDTAAAPIAAEVARRDRDIGADLADAIARDRPALMAELDSIGPIAAARAR